MAKEKRFEDWPRVDCDECARYWDSSCDGVKEGSEKECKSFVASRKVTIPARLKKVEDDVGRLKIAFILTNAVLLLHIVTHLIGG